MDIGAFRDGASQSPMFYLDLDLSTHDFHEQWKRCNMVANYVAEYTAYQFERKERAENLISTVLNELLEATVKSSVETEVPIKLSFSQFPDTLVFEVSHGLNGDIDAEYTKFLSLIHKADIEGLYLSLMTADDSASVSFNQLGLVVLVHDFSATIAARVDEANGLIRTQVQIPAKEVAA